MWPLPGQANDSTGFQGTTGIELSATRDIEMVSEDLRIGPDEIRVSYVFRNVTDHPVETIVAFPLPDLDLSAGLEAPNWGFPVNKPDFLDFKLWVNDRPVPATLERRAQFKGQDVTRELAAAGVLDIGPWKPGGYDPQFAHVPKETITRLREAGLVTDGDDDHDMPTWVLQTKYFWTQTFPAGAETRIRHVYKPFVGRMVGHKSADIGGKTAVGRLVGEDRSGADRYCIDGATRKALQTIETRQPVLFSPWEIEYILTTARNWRGPIGRFRLVIDKGAPENIVSLCWNGLRKTGPTTFESTIRDYVPDRDIRLLILSRGPASF
ncbi:DUF4424 family protein [Paramagnetospirillum marisnigri]|uniref:DUF4424 family protein n=1 Tax=Paramagnetospirillum marisnigri TaxID=1285242 RepID=UPI0015614E54|nr:DUF4424 family protein [Paramagnetospirillum marisnigri]